MVLFVGGAVCTFPRQRKKTVTVTHFNPVIHASEAPDENRKPPCTVLFLGRQEAVASQASFTLGGPTRSTQNIVVVQHVSTPNVTFLSVENRRG